MKRLASPKMRHVRALSPYANARGTEQGPSEGSKISFLSLAAGKREAVDESEGGSPSFPNDGAQNSII